MFPYTVALTSCARFDLLERTLASLLPRLEGPCERIIVGEDSGDRGVFETVGRFRPDAPPIQVILNPRRLGICRNIDRIYSEIETEWIFHCEDDWEFYRSGFIRESFEVMQVTGTLRRSRPGGFIRESIHVMQDDAVSSVSLRDISDFRPG
ncbi:MAG: glycosyltransferase [Rhodospirillaceae bacterium]|nr:glycosyltransferase [Rhodospirillaceae bacterium]MYF87291.1 glycosyltransferase [Rhodospirillaceae bacterium]MYH37276.1 glycosyltransferase [Rhodospirillaceae bacterium]MYK14886.1 glycosyltransferase [Rhodospirillaceae bacterium]MYK57749.1 glycosyltransferase [Rhodospirillaceae bacterium]